ncbi:MAG: hypothetical protein ABI686_01585 [Acidobacteriota bacterium]
MKIKKLFIGVFAATYLFGCLAFVVFVSYNKSKQSAVKNNLSKTSFIVEKPETELDAKIMNSCCYRDNFAKTISAEEYQSETDFEVFNLADFGDASDVDDYNKYFLETGEVSNGEDIKAKSGETWFGFFNESNEDVLRPTKIKISHRKENTLTWTNISVKDKNEPLFLVKGLKNIKKRKVVTLFRGVTFEEADENKQPTYLRNGFVKDFRLGETNYTLRVKEGVNEEQQRVWVLLLETGKVSQIISHITYSGEEAEVGNLFWVGDLDGDNKLDFYMDFYGYEKGYYSTGLFLSSEAKKGKLVKNFDYLMFGGC